MFTYGLVFIVTAVAATKASNRLVGVAVLVALAGILASSKRSAHAPTTSSLSHPVSVVLGVLDCPRSRHLCRSRTFVVPRHLRWPADKSRIDLRPTPRRLRDRCRNFDASSARAARQRRLAHCDRPLRRAAVPRSNSSDSMRSISALHRAATRWSCVRSDRSRVRRRRGRTVPTELARRSRAVHFYQVRLYLSHTVPQRSEHTELPVEQVEVTGGQAFRVYGRCVALNAGHNVGRAPAKRQLRSSPARSPGCRSSTAPYPATTAHRRGSHHELSVALGS